MRIKLQNDWFAPTVSERVGSGAVVLVSNGRLYRGAGGPEGGIHDVPDILRTRLPKSAVILDEGGKSQKNGKTKAESLKDFDEARAAAEAMPNQ